MLERCEDCAGGCIPENDRRIFRTAGDDIAVRRIGCGEDGPCVAFQFQDWSSISYRPELDVSSL
jgi:hypothetical protein